MLQLWSKEIRARDKVCQICGSNQRLQAHHILPKERWQEYKFELMNGITLCANCHKFGKYSVQFGGLWFTEWLRINKPNYYHWCMQHLNYTHNVHKENIAEG